jgi:hypothetical protein
LAVGWDRDEFYDKSLVFGRDRFRDSKRSSGFIGSQTNLLKKPKKKTLFLFRLAPKPTRIEKTETYPLIGCGFGFPLGSTPYLPILNLLFLNVFAMLCSSHILK